MKAMSHSLPAAAKPTHQAAASESKAAAKSMPVSPSASINEDGEGRQAEIRELAYALYERRGGFDGHDVEDWLQAEAVVRQRGKPAA